MQEIVTNEKVIFKKKYLENAKQNGARSPEEECDWKRWFTRTTFERIQDTKIAKASDTIYS